MHVNKETALECKNHDTKKVFNGHQSEYMAMILKDLPIHFVWFRLVVIRQ